MSLKDFLFPKICVGCSYLGAYICPKCQKKLAYVEKEVCFFCKKPSPFGLTHYSCQKKLFPQGIMTIFYYNDLLKKIIKLTKYQLATEVLKELFAIVAPKKVEKLSFFANLKNAVFQPIPLYPAKERKRGFNQARLITSFFQKFLPFQAVDYLQRKKETKPQAEIKERKKRYLNIRGAFLLNPKTKVDKEKTIIVVDDVLTTGLTALEAVKTLKKEGFKEVFVLALAKA
jgi:competence protein ComFC